MTVGPVVVVGGGVTGLLIAARLHQAGRRAVVLEAGTRLGGQVRTVEFAGAKVDVGAEAVFVASPAVQTLLEELGLWECARRAAPGRTWLATPAGLRRLPAGVGPAGPTRLWPVVRSGMLSPVALLRAGLEPLVAGADQPLQQGEDVSVGSFVTRRFGSAVTKAFVDPLLGGIHAGDVDALSLRACTPMLLPKATARRSLVLRGRRPAGPRGAAEMSLVSFPAGMGQLIDTLAGKVPDVRLGTTVERLSTGADGGVIVHGRGAQGHFDLTAESVVLTVPSKVTAQLLGPVLPAAGPDLTASPPASVANLLVAFPATPDVRNNPALDGTGILVPSTAGRLLKAATYLSTKWPQLGGRSDVVLVRLSAGRAGTDVAERLSDAELIHGMLADFADLTGVTVAPQEQLLIRWPGTMPQQTVGHQDRVRRVRDAIAQAGLPVLLAGSSYDGVGIPACFASGERTVAVLTESAVLPR